MLFRSIALAKKEWSQARLAKEVGLSCAAVSRLANNKNWSVDSLTKMSKIFGMKVSEFVALGED